MSAPQYRETVTRFESYLHDPDRDRPMAALIIDSPWLPGYLGVDTLDFLFDPETWLAAWSRAIADLPGVAFVPGSWWELGMAAEPSGWGTPIRWSRVQPPSVIKHPASLADLADAPVPDPEIDGLMPVILRHYERMMPRLTDLGMAPRMACARGPMAVASHLTGVTELLMATQLEREACLTLIEKTTDHCIAWLSSQLERMPEPLGILVNDDIVGMISPDDARTFALPWLRRIFEAFPGLVHFYHNDTPNRAMLEGLADIGMDVFNFSHEIDMQEARNALGERIILMGNLPPLELLVRGTPEEVAAATAELVGNAGSTGPLLVSAGGGVSPGTPIGNLQAMAEVVMSV
jgi:uroporphyrinogen decarboxylase